MGSGRAAQLRGAGCLAPHRDHWLRAGRLHRVHRGVYALGHTRAAPRGPPPGGGARLRPGAVLSHRSAAAHWGLLRTDQTRIDVTAPRGRHGAPGIRLHRSRSLDAQDTTHHEGIPITTVSRTLLDLAAHAHAPASSSARSPSQSACALRPPRDHRRHSQSQRAPRNPSPGPGHQPQAQMDPERMGSRVPGPHPPGRPPRARDATTPSTSPTTATANPTTTGPNTASSSRPTASRPTAPDRRSETTAPKTPPSPPPATASSDSPATTSPPSRSSAYAQCSRDAAAPRASPGSSCPRRTFDRLAPHLVADRDRAADDAGQGAGAAVLDEPLRAAHGGRAVLARRAERALAVAPEVALLLLGRRARCGRRRGTRPAARSARGS